MDELGNVYATGYFEGTVDFDPNAGEMNLTSNDQNDIFLLKLDLEGNFIWAKNWGGSGNDEGKAIAIDTKSNLYLTGFFQIALTSILVLVMRNLLCKGLPIRLYLS